MIIINTNDVTTQIIINRVTGGNNWIATRRCSGSPLAWTPWSIFENTGWLRNLQTTDKNSIVSAINEVNSKLNIWANTATWTPNTANMKVGESRPIMCGTAFMGSVIGQTIAGTGTISKTGTDIYSIIIMNCNAAGTLWGLYGIRWNAGVWAYNKFF